MRYFVVLSILALAILGVVSAALGNGQDDDITENVLTVDPVFLSFYESHEGPDILGVPITESFLDPITGLLVQYYRNGRLELAQSDSLEGEWQIRVTPLGEILGGWQPPLEGDHLDFAYRPGCRFFSETWHMVCHSFLDFFETHGGAKLFGYPISEIQVENGTLVQYFQNFRFEWKQGSSPSNEITFSPLGQMHFDLMGYNRDLLQENPDDTGLTPLAQDLKLESSVALPTIHSGDVQTVYLTVRDQNLRPLSGASVLLKVLYPTGTQVLLMPVTDKNGVSMIEITTGYAMPGGDVALEFQVLYRDVRSQTRDSFIVR
jgi:hypothetical protein